MALRSSRGSWLLAVLTACAGTTGAPSPTEVVIAAPSAAPPVEGPAEPLRAPTKKPSLLGRWTGHGRQSDGPTWSMEAEIVRLEPGRCATISYPSLDCGGHWECLPGSTSASLRATEHITKAPDRCIDGGTVEMELSKDGDTLLWRWRDDRSELTAEARLQRAVDAH